MTLTRIFLITFIFAPLYAYAQSTGLIPCNGLECQACDLLKLFQNLMNAAVTLAVFLATIGIAWNGFKMVAQGKDNPMMHTFFRQKMKNIIIGFVLMLGAWVIVDAVMKSFLSDDFNKAIGGWNTIQCTPQPVPLGGKISLGGSISKPGSANPIIVTGSSEGAPSAATVAKIKSDYATAIKNACSGSPMGQAQCESTVAAIISIESSGNPQAQSKFANGIMQVKPDLGGRTCAPSDSACIEAQIKLGTSMLNKSYEANKTDMTKMAAEYNGGGAATKESSCCSAGLAYQCDWDCGSSKAHSYSCEQTPRPSQCTPNTGFVETRNYIAKFCVANPGAQGCPK